MGNVSNELAKDKEIVLQAFHASLEEHGATVQGVLYGSQESQSKRFQVLSEIADLTGKSILDVGSGLGDLYTYLTSAFSHYTGVDINPEMVAQAQARCPHAHFECRDLLQEPLTEKFDYVLASGTFNLQTPHWTKWTRLMLRAMFTACKRGVGVNFLDVNSPFGKDKGSVYLEPTTILAYIRANLSPWATLRQDYRANDFTIYAFREPV